MTTQCLLQKFVLISILGGGLCTWSLLSYLEVKIISSYGYHMYVPNTLTWFMVLVPYNIKVGIPSGRYIMLRTSHYVKIGFVIYISCKKGWLKSYTLTWITKCLPNAKWTNKGLLLQLLNPRLYFLYSFRTSETSCCLCLFKDFFRISCNRLYMILRTTWFKTLAFPNILKFVPQLIRNYHLIH